MIMIDGKDAVVSVWIYRNGDDGDDEDNVKRKHSATVDLGQVCQNAKA